MEAVAANGSGPARGSALRRVLAGSIVGTALEWYDFFIYGTAAALVGFSPTLSTALLSWGSGDPWLVAAWMIFACAVSLVAFLASEETRDLDIGVEEPEQDALVTGPKVAKDEKTLATVGS